MSPFIDQRLSSAIRDLEEALEHLRRKEIEAAQRSIEEAIRKAKHAKRAATGKELICS